MPHLLRVSEAASLALHASALLAAAEGKKLLTRGRMAEFLNVSEAHLTKVLQRLGKLGLVCSVRGPTGGFRLDKPAEDISLLEVYEAIEGPVSKENCLLREQVCRGSECVLGDLLKLVNEDGKRYLAKTNLKTVGKKGGANLLKEMEKTKKQK